VTCLPRAMFLITLLNTLPRNRKRFVRLLHLPQVRDTLRTASLHVLTVCFTGNIAIGNLQQFLPVILKLVQSDAKKRLLSLHALKEVSCYLFIPSVCTLMCRTKVVTNCSHGQLEGVADLLWVPLFETSDNTETTTRNVAGACLGKLTTTHPSRYLPQLHVRCLQQM
jgi:hypothetical protein